MKTDREHERRVGPWTAARGVREQARARLERAARAVVASSIETLAEHLPAAGPKRARGAADAAERTRTVLAIDRSTRAQAWSAGRPLTPPPAPPLPATPARPTVAPPDTRADALVACDEPIKTRSMARLLATQGHPQRALSILEYLLARNGADEALRAEAEALRATIAAG